VLDKSAKTSDIIASRSDALIAAGGDGTVAAAARRLHGESLPIAILPIGTANNIAKSLRVDAPIDDLMERWPSLTPRALDLGVTRGWWGERYFFEAVGAGLIPAGTATAKAASQQEDNPGTVPVPDAARQYLQVLSRLRAQPLTIRLDGVPMTGEFLVLEVMNISSIGPNLLLSLHADPSDGMLSVVIATEDHRGDLEQYLGERAEGDPPHLGLPVQHVRRVEIEQIDLVHVDDKYLVSRTPEPVEMEILPGVVHFLV
jgi:diacylglycerol kinase family enzyme